MHSEFKLHIDIDDDISMRYACLSSEYETRKHEEIIYDVLRAKFTWVTEEQPTNKAQNFYDLLKATQRLLWEDCMNYTELSMTIRMISIKIKLNMPYGYFN